MLEQDLAAALPLPPAHPVWHAGQGSPIVAACHTEYPPGRRRR